MSQRKKLDRNQNDLESAISGRGVGHKNDRYRIQGKQFKVPLPSKSRERLKRGRKREAETNRRQREPRTRENERNRKEQSKPEVSFSCRHTSLVLHSKAAVVRVSPVKDTSSSSSVVLFDMKVCVYTPSIHLILLP